MFELPQVEEGGRLVDVLDPEEVDDLADRPDLNVVGRSPAQQGEVVDHRLRQVAPFAEVTHRHVVAPLGQLLAGLVDQQRQVGVGRVRCAHGVEQQEHLGHAREQVLAADGMGDAHVGVVDGVGQEKHR